MDNGKSDGNTAKSSIRGGDRVWEALGKLREVRTIAPPINVFGNVWITDSEQSAYQTMAGCSLLILTPKKKPAQYRRKNLEEARRLRRRPLAVQEYNPVEGLSIELIRVHIPLFFEAYSSSSHIVISAPDMWVALQAICAWLLQSDTPHFKEFYSVVKDALPEIARKNLAISAPKID